MTDVFRGKADFSNAGIFDGNPLVESRSRHLPRPPRVSWDEAEQRIAPILLSFMSESRRLSNARMKRELRVRLRYPTPQALLAEVAPHELRKQLQLPL